MEGLRNLLAAGVAVRLNFVLCGFNVDELPQLPGFIKDVLCRGVENPNIAANFSYVAASTDNVPRDTKLIPRFSDVAWAMEAAHLAAVERGIVWTGFDSKCGVPACYLPKAVREKHFTTDRADGGIGIHRVEVGGPVCIGSGEIAEPPVRAVRNFRHQPHALQPPFGAGGGRFPSTETLTQTCSS